MTELLHKYFLLDSQYRGLFMNIGNHMNVKLILVGIKNGDPYIAYFLNKYCSPADAARAVIRFLLFKRPLLPQRVQDLIIAKNIGVTSRMVAFDALGLTLEQFDGKKIKLIHR